MKVVIGGKSERVDIKINWGWSASISVSKDVVVVKGVTDKLINME